MTPVALVTGGAHGLGRAACIALGDRGYRIVVADIDRAAGEETAAAVDGVFVQTDVADLDQNHHMIDEALRHFGRLDVINLNAGIATGCDLGPSFDIQTYRRAFGINLDGVVFGIHAALPALEEDGGAIVVTSSLAGLAPLPEEPLYTANKHAVIGLVRALAPRLAQRRIRVSAVCPGFADSRFIDRRRDRLAASGVPIIPAGVVATVVADAAAGDHSGECWIVQPGSEPHPHYFGVVEGPIPK